MASGDINTITPKGYGSFSNDNVRILNKMEYNGVKLTIYEYKNLLGGSNARDAYNLWFMSQQNICPRQVCFEISNDSVRLQAGAMSYFRGPLEMVSDVSLGNFVGKFFKGSVTGESMAQPIYSGSGTLVCEPSFKHFVPFILGPGESVIVDKGLFYAASKEVKINAVMQKNLSSGLLGNEGWFQIGLTGPGLVVLELPVPFSEIDILTLNNDVLRVDGNFALLRSGNLEFTVERSAKTLMGSAVSGEGLVNVLRGTGEVWLAPTIDIYNMIH